MKQYSVVRRLFPCVVKKQPSPKVRRLLCRVYADQKGVGYDGRVFRIDSATRTDNILIVDPVVTASEIPHEQKKEMRLYLRGKVPIPSQPYERWPYLSLIVNVYPNEVLNDPKLHEKVKEVHMVISSYKSLCRVKFIKLFFLTKPNELKDVINECFEMAYLTVKHRSGNCPGIDGVIPRLTEEKEGFPVMKRKVLQDLKTAWHKMTDESVVPFVLKPDPCRVVLIPKLNLKFYLTGKIEKARPLSIPTVKDRVIATMLYFLMAPIYEPLFSDNSFGFRPGRDVVKAILRAIDFLHEGYRKVVKLDLEDFFETVDHDILGKILKNKIDDCIVNYITQTMLKQKFVIDMKSSLASCGGEIPEKSKKYLALDGTIRMVGVPQGNALSPLLANIYLDRLDKLLEKLQKRNVLRFVRYADDVVLFFRKKKDINKELKKIVRFLQTELRVRVNEDKTEIIDNEKEGFKMYGFEITNKGKITMNSENLVRAKLALLDKIVLFKGHKSELVDKLYRSARAYAQFYSHLASHCFEDIDQWFAETVEIAKKKNRKKVAQKKIKEIAKKFSA